MKRITIVWILVAEVLLGKATYCHSQQTRISANFPIPAWFRMDGNGKQSSRSAAEYIEQQASPSLPRRLNQKERHDLKALFISAANHKHDGSQLVRRSCPLVGLVMAEFPPLQALPGEDVYLGDIAHVLANSMTEAQIQSWFEQRSRAADVEYQNLKLKPVPGFKFPDSVWYSKNPFKVGSVGLYYLDEYPVPDVRKVLSKPEKQQLIRFMRDAYRLSMKLDGFDECIQIDCPLMRLIQANFPATLTVKKSGDNPLIHDVLDLMK